MTKIINPKLFKIANLVLFAFVVLLAAETAWGQTTPTNPVTGKFEVHFIRNGVKGSEKINVPGLWVPLYQPWNGKFTVNGPTKLHPASGQMEKPRIPNATVNLTFHGSPGHHCGPGTCPMKNITAAEINAYWDARNVGSTRIEEPTWSMNCHGHSTGLGYWVNNLLVVTSCDWESCETDDKVTAGCLLDMGAHSVKITEVTPINENRKVVTETTEKEGEAGIYKTRYSLSDGLPLYPKLTYKHK